MGKLAFAILFSLIAGIAAVVFFAEPPDAFQTEVLYNLACICGILILLCFILSILTDNFSQTDKMWSIAPIMYAWTIAFATDFQPRIVLMSALITIWGIRLTYNFGRMGGYSLRFWTGHEDYRWRIVKSKPGLKHPLAWHSFNLFFIAGYQNILLLLLTLPVLASYSVNASDINTLDILLAVIVLGLIVLETIADQQQQNFQKEKKRRIQNGEPLINGYEKGFVHTGLWSLSRHPNYLAEQSIWVFIWLFSVNATGNLGNFSIIGCLLLIILFQGSSFLTEQIASEKYPEYKVYQKKVGKFFPKINLTNK